MEISQWTASLTELLSTLEKATTKLCTHICNDIGDANYYFDGEVERDAEKARTAIAHEFSHWDYTEQIHTRAGFVMVSKTTIELAKQVNQLKDEFEAKHISIRAHIMKYNSEAKEVKASEIMRRILTLVGRAQLDLNKADRHIPFLTEHVKKIRWFENTSQTTTRQPIKKVLTELEKIADSADNYIAELALQEHAHLMALGPDTTVAYRPKAAVRSIRYSAQLYATQSKRTLRGYGASPVLIPYFDESPEAIFFNDVRKKGAGRPTSVSNKRVSELIPHYFYYKSKIACATQKKSIKKAKNPYSKTKIPGMFFTIRRPFRPVIVIPKSGGGSTELSLKNKSISQVWPSVINRYTNKSLTHTQALEYLAPSQEQYERFIEWEKHKRQNMHQDDTPCNTSDSDTKKIDN